MLYPASVQDRDGPRLVLKASHAVHSRSSTCVLAHAGYASERVSAAMRIAVDIIRKRPDQVGLTLRPRHCMVKRLFA
jgi:putative transposase